MFDESGFSDSDPWPPASSSSDEQAANRATSTSSLWQLVAEDNLAHGYEASRLGFQALLVDRFGLARMKIKPARALAVGVTARSVSSQETDSSRNKGALYRVEALSVA
jgi:hypothetical protein